MAKTYRRRSHSKTVRKHKGRKGSKGRKTGKRSSTRRSRRGGLSWAEMKAKANSASQSLKQNMKDGAAIANTHFENAKAQTSAKLANSPTFNSMKQGMSSGLSKASSMGTATMGRAAAGLGSAKSGMTNAYNSRFGNKQALDAAGRSNAGVANANPFGSQTLTSTTAPTMPQ
ncbi:hypothetical protein N9K75_02920 [bacterium]|nr:hypothetical protein [bacterium]